MVPSNESPTLLNHSLGSLQPPSSPIFLFGTEDTILQSGLQSQPLRTQLFAFQLYDALTTIFTAYSQLDLVSPLSSEALGQPRKLLEGRMSSDPTEGRSIFEATCSASRGLFQHEARSCGNPTSVPNSSTEETEPAKSVDNGESVLVPVKTCDGRITSVRLRRTPAAQLLYANLFEIVHKAELSRPAVEQWAIFQFCEALRSLSGLLAPWSRGSGDPGGAVTRVQEKLAVGRHLWKVIE
ncbi:unnamed protein product [Protopolystoma xenopodis]|uniref:Uncharacterized protein n=1 Tax=Protopolystoma xenopodis TaxID=117903 RepID=A0A448WN68_9PLAT|nr:unnamed protein product [Protopolystoma xenopodis]